MSECKLFDSGRILVIDVSLFLLLDSPVKVKDLGGILNGLESLLEDCNEFSAFEVCSSTWLTGGVIMDSFS